MKRTGTVLVFKVGVTPKQAARAVKMLEDVLDPNYHVHAAVMPQSSNREVVIAADGKRTLASIESFDDAHGGPVFYIP